MLGPAEFRRERKKKITDSGRERRQVQCETWEDTRSARRGSGKIRSRGGRSTYQKTVRCRSQGVHLRLSVIAGSGKNTKTVRFRDNALPGASKVTQERRALRRGESGPDRG